MVDRKVEAGEVFALVDEALGTYKGKFIVSWGEKIPWDGKKKKLVLLGSKRLITMEGKKCGFCLEGGKGHSVLVCKALATGGMSLRKLSLD